MPAPLIVPAALVLAPLADLPPALALTGHDRTALQSSHSASSAPAPQVPAEPPQPDAAPVESLPPVVPSSTEPAAPAQSEAASEQAATAPVHHHAPGDPLEGVNRTMFDISQSLDHAVYRPAAMAYKHAVPKPLRSGIRNILSNLTEPIVFLNFILQGKPREAMETLTRFVLNSTLGVGGAFDVAKNDPIDLPHRNNGFGTTLAIYGVGSGPYLFFPLVGPTTLRDLLGGAPDGLVLPKAVGHPFDTTEYQISTIAVGGLDLRAESDAQVRALFGGAVDPYATLRSVWLQNRKAEIDAIRGRPAAKAVPELQELDDPLADPARQDSSPAQSSQGSAPPPELNDPLADPAASGGP